MRVGNFEILLLQPNASVSVGTHTGETVVVDDPQLFYEERLIGDQTFAIAKESQEYIVKVIVHRDSGRGVFDYKYLRIGLYVDQHDVQYWKRIETENESPLDCYSTTFTGFKESSQSNTLRAFTFAIPAYKRYSNLAQLTPDEVAPEAGNIRVVIYEAVPVDGIYHNNSGQYSAPNKQVVDPDKKFFTQPSLTTTAGRVLTGVEKFQPVTKWVNVSPSPVCTLIMNYHNRGVLDILKIMESNKEALKCRKRGLDQVANENAGNEGGGRGEGDGDDDIQHVPQIKHVITIDFTDDQDNPTESVEVVQY